MTKKSTAESTLTIDQSQLDRITELLDIDPDTAERLRHPKKVHEVTVPIKHDDGSVEVFTGYRAQYDDIRGGF